LFSFEPDAYDVLSEYLLNSARLKDEPYELEATCLIMVLPATQVQTKLKDTFVTIIDEHYYTLNAHQTFHHIDHIVHLILRILQPNPEFFDIEFARAFVSYLWARDTENEAVTRTLGECDPKFIGSLLTKYLAHFARYPTEGTLHSSMAGTIHAILRLCWLTGTRQAVFDEETLTLVLTTPRFPVSSCAVALLKSHILMDAAELPPNQLDALMDRLHIPYSDESHKFALGGPTERWKEAFFVLLVEFLEQSKGLAVPDEWNRKQAVRTFEFLVKFHPWGQVSNSLQRQFATWLLNATSAPSIAFHTHLIKAIINWKNRFLLGSISDQIARTKIRTALNTYVSTPSDGDKKTMRTLRRVNELLIILDSSSTDIDPDLPEGAISF